MAACATLVDRLLRAAPDLRILATSREALGITGEVAWALAPLAVPDRAAVQRSPDAAQALGQYAAVRLFIDRAVAVRPEFAVTNANAPSVAEICHRLDGIPLALELAAARVKMLPVEDIAERLGDRFRLLTGGSRTALPRQQTLRAAVDWSYDLLDDLERPLMARLAVFRGGWTLEAAEAVCAGGELEGWEVLDHMSQLADKSLVVVAEAESGATRFRYLETVRQYATEKLVASGEEGALRDRHLAHFLALAESTEPGLTGPDQARLLGLLAAEHDNLRAALEHAATGGGALLGQRLGGAIWRFWEARGHLTAGRASLAAVLDAPGGEGPTPERAKALHGAGVLALRQGDYAAARAFNEESLAIRRALGDTKGIAALLSNQGLVARAQGDYALARSLNEESLAIKREMGDQWGAAISLGSLGLLAFDEGDYAAARRYHEESLAIRRTLGDRAAVAIALGNLGLVAQVTGDYATARALHEESLAIRRELGDKQRIALSLGNLGDLGHAQADYDLARSLYGECLELHRDLGDKRGVVERIESFGWLASATGDAERATRLLGAAEALRVTMGIVHQGQSDQARHDQSVAASREALGAEAFDAAWALGRAMTLEEAVAVAVGDDRDEPVGKQSAPVNN